MLDGPPRPVGRGSLRPDQRRPEPRATARGEVESVTVGGRRRPVGRGSFRLDQRRPEPRATARGGLILVYSDEQEGWANCSCTCLTCRPSDIGTLTVPHILGGI